MKVISRTGAVLTLLSMLTFGTAGAAAADGVNRVDINTASVGELTALPGIGPAKAEAIVEERQRELFRSVTDLTRVTGIGERTLEQLRGRVSVNGLGAGSKAIPQ